MYSCTRQKQFDLSEGSMIAVYIIDRKSEELHLQDATKECRWTNSLNQRLIQIEDKLWWSFPQRCESYNQVPQN